MATFDIALREREQEGKPIRVALVGAGVTARMIALQLAAPGVPGIRLVAIANRTPSRAIQAFQHAGVDGVAAPLFVIRERSP